MPIENKQIYIADFETTNDPQDCRVWAACAVRMEDNEVVFLDNNLDAFMTFLSKHNSICYFHNLGFDGQFILYWLLTHKFKYQRKGGAKTFDTTIGDNGAFYSINVRFSKKGRYWKQVQFRDSLKKINSSVRRIAKDYDLPLEKLEIDYNAAREKGHILTDQERDYVIADCKIVSAALKQYVAEGLNKLTAASDAFNIYRYHFLGDRRFQLYFPTLPIDIDKDIRQAYRGGFTYLNPKYKNRPGVKGIVLDVNSEYPYIMKTKPLPVGYPVFFEGKPKDDPRFPLYIVMVEMQFDLIKDHIPCIQIKNTFAYRQNEYLTTSDVHYKIKDNVTGEMIEQVDNTSLVTLYLTNIDLALIKEQYHVEPLRYIKGWRFQAKTGLFDKYIDHWYEIKRTSKGAKRAVAKIMQNSLYGKFAVNPVRRAKIPYLDNDVVRYSASEVNTIDPIYTALSIFVTSYGRDLIVRAAQANYDRFIYSDTDSIHLEGYELPDGINIDDHELGAFKIEEQFADSLYIRQKTYMHTTNDNITVKCAGMPDNCKKLVTYDNFHVGSSFPGKLLPKRVPGGVVLQETCFTISE